MVLRPDMVARTLVYTAEIADLMDMSCYERGLTANGAELGLCMEPVKYACLLKCFYMHQYYCILG